MLGAQWQAADLEETREPGLDPGSEQLVVLQGKHAWRVAAARFIALRGTLQHLVLRGDALHEPQEILFIEADAHGRRRSARQRELAGGLRDALG